jgi:cobalt-zinc-cadmium efflux system protein
MGHHHHASGKNLGIAVLLNILISAGQFAGGLISGSISLLTDALHNFSDVLSLLLSWYANKIARKPARKQYTYGYKRAEILAAFINALTLIFMAVFLIIEAVKRFLSPEIIDSEWVIYFALASIVINILSVILLHKDARNNLNIKSAYLHLLTDVMTSIAVLAGGLMMKFYQIYWIDSLLSVLIALYLIFSSLHILKYSIRILMQATPAEVDIKELLQYIKSFNEVNDVTDFHLWQLNEKDWYFSACVILKDENVNFFQLDKKISNHPVLKQCREIIVKYKSNF